MVPCPNTQPHPQHGECIGVMRRATAREIALARAYAEHVVGPKLIALPGGDGAPQADLDAVWERDVQHEYEGALEVLIFANGGRYSEPVLFPEETR